MLEVALARFVKRLRCVAYRYAVECVSTRGVPRSMLKRYSDFETLHNEVTSCAIWVDVSAVFVTVDDDVLVNTIAEVHWQEVHEQSGSCILAKETGFSFDIV
jgi:hypothetical protein